MKTLQYSDGGKQENAEEEGKTFEEVSSEDVGKAQDQIPPQDTTDGNDTPTEEKVDVTTEEAAAK